MDDLPIKTPLLHYYNNLEIIIKSLVVSYPLAILVFSDFVITFKSGLTFVAQEAIYIKRVK